MAETMKALVMHGVGNLSLDDVPVPELKHEKDAIVKVTLSTICGSDIHMAAGKSGVNPPLILGHEFCGEIMALGKDVRGFSAGDRVAVSCAAHCGGCFFCREGLFYHCEDPGCTCFGYGKKGGPKLDGCQAEYVRLPYAETCMHKIPEECTEEDVLFAGDILSTGYFGAEKAGIHPGDTVLVVGAGPVGMCAALCARLWSPAEILIADLNAFRLGICRREGLADATIDSSKEDAVGFVRERTNGRGADRVIEAIGLEDTLVTAMRAVRTGGTVSTVGLYTKPVTLPMQSLWYKNISVSMGFVATNRMDALLKLIAAGKLDTKFLMTHRAPLNDIVRGYDVFGNKKDDCLKWVVTPYER